MKWLNSREDAARSEQYGYNKYRYTTHIYSWNVLLCIYCHQWLWSMIIKPLFIRIPNVKWISATYESSYCELVLRTEAPWYARVSVVRLVYKMYPRRTQINQAKRDNQSNAVIANLELMIIDLWRREEYISFLNSNLSIFYFGNF